VTRRSASTVRAEQRARRHAEHVAAAERRAAAGRDWPATERAATGLPWPTSGVVELSEQPCSVCRLPLPVVDVTAGQTHHATCEPSPIDTTSTRRTSW